MPNDISNQNLDQTLVVNGVLSPNTSLFELSKIYKLRQHEFYIINSKDGISTFYDITLGAVIASTTTILAKLVNDKIQTEQKLENWEFIALLIYAFLFLLSFLAKFILSSKKKSLLNKINIYFEENQNEHNTEK